MDFFLNISKYIQINNIGNDDLYQTMNLLSIFYDFITNLYAQTDFINNYIYEQIQIKQTIEQTKDDPFNAFLNCLQSEEIKYEYKYDGYFNKNETTFYCYQNKHEIIRMYHAIDNAKKEIKLSDTLTLFKKKINENLESNVYFFNVENCVNMFIKYKKITNNNILNFFKEILFSYNKFLQIVTEHKYYLNGVDEIKNLYSNGTSFNYNDYIYIT